MVRKTFIALVCLVLMLLLSGCGGIREDKSSMEIHPDLVIIDGGYASNNIHYCYDGKTGVIYLMYYRGITVCLKADGTPMTVSDLIASEEEQNNGYAVDTVQ